MLNVSSGTLEIFLYNFSLWIFIYKLRFLLLSKQNPKWFNLKSFLHLFPRSWLREKSFSFMIADKARYQTISLARTSNLRTMKMPSEVLPRRRRHNDFGWQIKDLVTVSFSIPPSGFVSALRDAAHIV